MPKKWLLLGLLLLAVASILGMNAHQSANTINQAGRIATVAVEVVEYTAVPQVVSSQQLAVSRQPTAIGTQSSAVSGLHSLLSPQSPLRITPLSPTPTPEPAWLSYLNQFRLSAGLPLLVEDVALSAGSQLHSEYMIIEDNPNARYQSKRSENYTEAGDRAARNANIFAMTSDGGEYDWAVNYWMTAPFHIVPMLDPQLESVGFGSFAGGGEVKYTAVLDVNSGKNETNIPDYPITFPQDGGKTWLTFYSLFEYPDPLTVCDDYQQPTGPPLVLLLGSDNVPEVTNYNLQRGDVLLDACLLYEQNYVNEDEYAQEVGRSVLHERGAVVLIPQQPLTVGSIYTASVTVNGEVYTWMFTAVARPESTFPVTPQYQPPDDIIFHWPVTNDDVYREYWPQHTGIDLLMPEGSPIAASEAGKIVFRGWDDRGYGNTIILDHGDGIRTLYAHMESFNMDIPRDGWVQQGDVIGYVGNTGNSDQPHIHFEIHFHYYHPVDPCNYLVAFATGDGSPDGALVPQACGSMMVLE